MPGMVFRPCLAGLARPTFFHWLSWRPCRQPVSLHVGGQPAQPSAPEISAPPASTRIPERANSSPSPPPSLRVLREAAPPSPAANSTAPALDGRRSPAVRATPPQRHPPA